MKTDYSGDAYFLTYFHLEHYGRMRRSALPPGARVLCSPVTASLVPVQLRVHPESQGEPAPAAKADVPNPRHPARGASVWQHDANHCPAAVVLLLHVWRTRRYVLHSGD